MQRSAQLITLAVSVILFVIGCSKINLTGGKGGSSTPSGAAGANAVLNPKAPPPINGDWRVSFIYNNEAYESLITFAQEGKVLTGKGEDSSGPFFITQGSVQGTNVRFVKKYADADASKPSVEYTGDLEWEDDEDYKGWRMGGHYKAKLSDGSVMDDKWVGISTIAEQAEQHRQQAAANPQPAPQQPEDQQPGQNQQSEQPAPSGGEPNLSGMYAAEYQFKFKKIHSKIWLEQDGSHVAGHGVDTNTNEKFVISKGWYHYPKLTIVCHYSKGQSAAANRDLTVKAQVQNGLSLRGETEFGGGWQAKIVR